jgi:hypothetical protein
MNDATGAAVKKCTLILSLAALVALGAVAATAQAADGLTVSRFPVSFSFFNPCTNENVEFSGTALTVVDPTPEDNHGLNFHSIDIALKGVGETTGTRYIETFAVTDSDQGTEEDPAGNGVFAETNSVHSRLIAPGPDNDLVFAIVFHFTINATGEIVGWHNRVTIEACV